MQPSRATLKKGLSIDLGTSANVNAVAIETCLLHVSKRSNKLWSLSFQGSVIVIVIVSFSWPGVVVNPGYRGTVEGSRRLGGFTCSDKKFCIAQLKQ